MKVNRCSWFYLSILIGTLIMISNSCKKEDMPSVTTVDVTSLGQTSASCGGTITSEGGSTILSRGVCWGTNATPKISDSKTTDGAGAGSFTSAITGLSAGTKYFVRAYATNSKGTGYGMAMSFTTLPALTVPIISTGIISFLTSSSAICGGNITNDGGSSITSKGVCWSTSAGPTVGNSKTMDGTGIGLFTSSITGLSSNITYYIRAYAANSLGTGYGSEISFKTLPLLTDINGNTYKTIQIGNQIWMADNLKTNKYSNGDLINSVNAMLDITNETDPKYQWSLKETILSWQNGLQPIIIAGGGGVPFTQSGLQVVGLSVAQATSVISFANNIGILINGKTLQMVLLEFANISGAMSDANGLLYTGYVINDSRNVCPTGWHIPTDNEWTMLTDYLGGLSVAGGKMKEAGTSHWTIPNTGADNSSGFNSLPGGMRYSNGDFKFNGLTAYWWSATKSSSTLAWIRSISYNNISITRDIGSLNSGMSVRCVKD